jgi:arabinose-5-phosphate isomerase
MNAPQIIENAKRTLHLEAQAVDALQAFVNEHFVEAVELLHHMEGRAVVSGIGKSAVIAQKMVATFNSTGTPALFMHAADAIHGDLGMIQPGDVVIVISKSGESPEIKVLLPLLKAFGNKVIALCGAQNSFLATEAHCFVNCTVEAEACPNNLAPTTSTTAQLAMGDALAVCLLYLKGFTAEDFARYHPGGALGKKLYLRVGSLLPAGGAPQVGPTATIQEVIYEISSKRLGATVVVEDGQLRGIITDGDLRRMLERNEDFRSFRAADIMSLQPRSVDASLLAVDALRQMQEGKITQLVVLQEGRYAGILHLNELLREGLS